MTRIAVLEIVCAASSEICETQRTLMKTDETQVTRRPALHHSSRPVSRLSVGSRDAVQGQG